MKRKSFTLVEILVVIAIITILMGLLFPALGMVKEKAYMRQSLSDVKAIHMAIKSFKNDYGYLPFSPASGEENKDVVIYGTKSAKVLWSKSGTPGDKNCFKAADGVFLSDEALMDDYTTLFSILCTRTPAGGDDTSNMNPKKVKFLTPTAKYTNSDSKKSGYRDPWGRPYLIYLDTNYDGEIKLADGKVIYDDAAVIGMGTYDPTAGSTDDKISKALLDKNASKIVTSWK